MLTITVEKLDTAVILHCSGRIVRGSETGLLCSAAQHQGRNVFLDLANIETIDAAGIGALVSLQAAGIYLKLLNPTERVVDLLRATKLNSIFEVFRSQSIPEGSGLGVPYQQTDSVPTSAVG